MNVFGLVNGSTIHHLSKLPRWAGHVFVVWLLFSASVYFGFVEPPDFGWWTPVLMAPMIILVLAAVLQILVFMASWAITPMRWLANKFGENSNAECVFSPCLEECDQ